MEKKTKRSPRRKASTEIAGIQIPQQLLSLRRTKMARPAAAILGAAALGGALYYFANPTNGAARRTSFVARIKSLTSSLRGETVMAQFNSIVSSVSGLFASWSSATEDVASDAKAKIEEAKSEASSFARKSSAKADEYVATH